MVKAKHKGSRNVHQPHDDTLRFKLNQEAKNVFNRHFGENRKKKRCKIFHRLPDVDLGLKLDLHLGDILKLNLKKSNKKPLVIGKANNLRFKFDFK